MAGSSRVSGSVAVPTPPTKRSALRRLAAMAASIPAEADLVLVGDSLAASWPAFGAYAASTCNLGLPGDRIQTTLWRLDTLAIRHLRPRLAVVLLGTNNLGDGDAPEAIASGLRLVAERIRALWTPAAIVVSGLPWRRPGGMVREADRLAANRALASVADAAGLVYLDPDPVLGVGAEAFGRTVAADGLHLLPAAYERLSEALSAMAA